MTFAPQLEDVLQNIKLKLSSPQDIVILSHRNPDGDAIGSSMALKRFLEKNNHRCKVVFPSECPITFNYLFDQAENPIIYDLDNKSALDAINNATLIFCLDFNSLDRIDKMGEAVMFSQSPIGD